MRRLHKQFYYAEITFGILTLLLGVLLYFLYEWTNYNYFASILSPINGSMWEHLKILFFPVVLLSIFEYFCIGRYFSAFIGARTIGCFAGIFFTVVFFYTYSGIIGTNYLWLDICTFFLATALCYCITWHLTTTSNSKKRVGNTSTQVVCILLLLLMFYLFLRFTKSPPSINLFSSMSYFPR